MTYREIIVILLGAQSFQPRTLTFPQVKGSVAHVRNGEHRSPITKVETWSQNDSETEAKSAEVERRKLLKHYTGFNACQTEGIHDPR